ncbi:MAG: hypothetical protein ABJL67_06515 [Sulfitobacter sp.]
MTLFAIILFGATTLVFVAWTVLMFRVLFAQRRRTIKRTGQTWPGPRDALKQWGVWLRDPAARKERRWLLILALSIPALSFLARLSLPSQP